MGDAYLPYMLSRPGVYDGARSSLRRGRRVPEKGAVATNAAGAGKRSSGSIMAHHLQLTHKSASSLSALLLGKHVLAGASRAVRRAASSASVFGSRRPALVQ